jgi:hypothetical protein
MSSAWSRRPEFLNRQKIWSLERPAEDSSNKRLTVFANMDGALLPSCSSEVACLGVNPRAAGDGVRIASRRRIVRATRLFGVIQRRKGGVEPFGEFTARHAQAAPDGAHARPVDQVNPCAVPVGSALTRLRDQPRRRGLKRTIRSAATGPLGAGETAERRGYISPFIQLYIQPPHRFPRNSLILLAGVRGIRPAAPCVPHPRPSCYVALKHRQSLVAAHPLRKSPQPVVTHARFPASFSAAVRRRHYAPAWTRRQRRVPSRLGQPSIRWATPIGQLVCGAGVAWPGINVPSGPGNPRTPREQRPSSRRFGTGVLGSRVGAQPCQGAGRLFNAEQQHHDSRRPHRPP